METNIETDRVERIQHTDIKIVAFLWCDEIALVGTNGQIGIVNPKITVDKVEKNINRKSKSYGQCLFYLVNRGELSFRNLIMQYYNDRAFVSPKAFTNKLTSCKDLIHVKND